MFNFGITSRLFFSLFAAILVAAIGSGVATRWSFQRGFIDYLDRREVNRVEIIALALGRGREANGNWDFIHGDGDPGISPVSLLGFTADCRTGTVLPRGLALFDKTERLIAGRVEDRGEKIRRPIVANGEVVGTLVGVPRRTLSTEAELLFMKHQLQTSWLAGIVAAILASTFAVFLARGALASIKDLIGATTQLAKGDNTMRVNEKRNDEIGLLARNFNCMAAAIESHEALRRQFMADTSHELRTPLAVLCAELEAMKDGVLPLTLESIHSLQEQARKLARLVDDIRQISLAEIGALQYEWQTLDPASLLEETRSIWGRRLAEKGITMEIQSCAGLLVRGDRGRLHQLLQNLIENVRIHAGGATLLRILLYREKDRAVIECHDNGQGVAADVLPKLFDRFWREDRSRSRDTGGSGLGLAICRSIVEAHGGQIQALHSVLGGLCTRTYLPLIEAGP
jgi:two-component system sensor histidine kinase BaeS